MPLCIPSLSIPYIIEGYIVLMSYHIDPISDFLSTSSRTILKCQLVQYSCCQAIIVDIDLLLMSNSAANRSQNQTGATGHCKIHHRELWSGSRFYVSTILFLTITSGCQCKVQVLDIESIVGTMNVNPDSSIVLESTKSHIES